MTKPPPAILLHNLGPRFNSNYNTPEEVLEVSADVVLTFDGIYANVKDHAHLFINRNVILFPCGDHSGKTNEFDSKNLPNFRVENFLTIEQCQELATAFGWRLGWHSWTHRNLTDLSEKEINKELAAPFPTKFFAYPYGNVNSRVAHLVQEAGYEEAWSVTQGDGTQFQRRRRYLNW